jgi:hypothetical protein
VFLRGLSQDPGARVIGRVVRASTALPAAARQGGRIPIADLDATESVLVRRMHAFRDARALSRSLCALRDAEPGTDGAGLALDAAPYVERVRDAAGIAPRHSIECSLDVETRNESNKRGHVLGAKHRRAKVQKRDVPTIVRQAFVGRVGAGAPIPARRVVLVTLTRLSPDALDDDGLVRAMKHVRDAVAKSVLRLDDADPRLHFAYEQADGKRVAMRVRMEWGFGE